MPHSIAHILSTTPMARLSRSVAGIPSFFSRLLQLRRERRALARLDRSSLADVGLDPTSARHESGRAFWDVPNHWRL